MESVCGVCALKIAPSSRRRLYCCERCRKTAEVRRYRFQRLHGVLIEDVLPKDGNWLSRLDVGMEMDLRACSLDPKRERVATSIVDDHSAKSANPKTAENLHVHRKGRRPRLCVVRKDLSINYMELRGQAFNIIIRGRALIKRRRSKTAKYVSGGFPSLALRHGSVSPKRAVVSKEALYLSDLHAFLASCNT